MKLTNTTPLSMDGSPSVKSEFDTLSEFVEYADRHTKQTQKASLSSRYREFYNNTSFAKMKSNTYAGVPDLVKRSEEFLDKIRLQIELETPVWVNSVVGSFPSVPDFLSGHPECMRRKVFEHSERSLVRVFVSIAASSGVDSESILNRGLAVLAFIQELSRIRPVELYLFSEGACYFGHGSNVQVINATGLLDSLSRAAYVISASEFSRYCCVGLDVDEYNSEGKWAYGTCGPHLISNPNSKYRKNIRTILGCSENDLVIPPMFLFDPDYKLWNTTPHVWVQKQLDKFFEHQGEEDYAI